MQKSTNLINSKLTPQNQIEKTILENENGDESEDQNDVDENGENNEDNDNETELNEDRNENRSKTNVEMHQRTDPQPSSSNKR